MCIILQCNIVSVVFKVYSPQHNCPIKIFQKYRVGSKLAVFRKTGLKIKIVPLVDKSKGMSIIAKWP